MIRWLRVLRSIVERVRDIFRDAGEDFVDKINEIRMKASGCVDEEEVEPC